MAKTLLVVDSPRKAKTLARWLGPEVRWMACSGPVRALPRHRMGVDVHRGFTVEYEVPETRQKEVRALAAAARDAEQVWLAAPPGGVGEAFCSLVAGSLPQPREAVRRIVLTEVTEPAFAAALVDRRPIDDRVAEAVLARNILDRLAGPALGWCLGEDRVRNGGLGRLHALTLALLGDRSGPAAPRAAPNGHVPPRSFQSSRDPAKAPTPLTVVGLVEACFEKHGLSARQALRLADRLHEGVDLPGGRVGLITSPRSEGPFGGGAAVIRPAAGGPDPSEVGEGLSQLESWLYRLVWERFGASQGRTGGAGVRASPPVERPWTEAALVRELVDSGVGPAASCAAVGAALEQSGLVEGVPAAVRPTPIGRRAGTRLRERFPELASATAAAALEEEVAALVRGEQNRLGLCRPFWKRIEQGLGRLPRRREEATESRSGAPPCERCGAPTLERVGPYGPFRACSNYPSCKGTRSLDAAPRAPEVGLLCPRCSSAPIVERLGPTGRLFYGCRAYPKCRFTTHHRPVADPCPQCGRAFLVEKPSRRNGPVLACTGCGYRRRAATTAGPRPD